jgi:2-keto-4-pentenoate hydratase/2-oxohepta-3-ene-1,7-dioic acid hydratase in catechol pathway
MRILTFRGDDGARLGVLHGDDLVVDVAELGRSAGDATLPATMLEAIQQGPDGLQRIRDLAGGAPSTPSPPVTRRLDDVALLAPLSPPVGNVAAVGRNYGKHVEEANRATGRPASQSTVSFFTKAQTSVAGPVDDLRLDFSISDQMDWEVELGVVIGRTGINISEDRALEHVFGYTVVNDISARDIQMNWGGQYFKGKSVDYSCPSGPWIVTKDEIGDPQSLQLQTLVNGVVKQDANTVDMIAGVAEIVSRLSFGMTLPAGTLIATGTPEGVGFARQPPEFLHDGDVLESYVERIGTLRNRIVAAVPSPVR